MGCDWHRELWKYVLTFTMGQGISYQSSDFQNFLSHLEAAEGLGTRSLRIPSLPVLQQKPALQDNILQIKSLVEGVGFTGPNAVGKRYPPSFTCERK